MIRSDWPDVSIPSDVTIAQFVFAPQHASDRVAIIEGETRATITFGELEVQSKRIASALVRTHKLAVGEVVAVVAANCIRYASVMLGASMAGATLTTVNPTYTAREIEHQLRDSQAKIVVTMATLRDRVHEAVAALQSQVRDVFLIDSDTDVDASRGFADLLDAQPIDAHVSVDPKSTAVLPYSSGTTGLAKGCCLSHTNVIANILQVHASGVTFGKDDTFVSFLPFFHVYGQSVLLFGGLRVGSTQITLQRFDLVKFLELNQEFACSWSFIAPPVAVALAKHPVVDNYKLKLKIVFSGAAPLGPELQTAVETRLGAAVLQGYGMSELSPVSHLVPVGARRPGSAGKTVANTEIKLVDSEGKPVAKGQPGELLVRGPQVMKGYLNNPAATAATIDADGFLHTGDVATIDDDGFIVIVDRIKELIKVAGFQVAPAELESLLLAHPKIADVAVIGIADDQSGEVPKAFVVKKGDVTEQEIKDWFKPQVATFKQLRVVQFVDSIPKSPSGKILRRVLRELEAAAKK
jgi:acyl-CoA synthetase (AMP-forming)/AMP-acid ligase II